MAGQLDELAADARAIGEGARLLVEQVGTARLSEHSADGGWSIAECLEHLNMTTRAFVPRWRDACARAPKAEGPYKTDLWGKLLVWTLEPPPKFRMPTTPQFQRIDAPPNERVLPTFLETHDLFLNAIDAGRGLALDRVKVRSPFQEKMQYSVWSSFRITVAHERRHLWQAERVARALAGTR